MADVFDDEAEQTVSIGEYLQNVEEAEQQELEADLVLGGDEGKECTYSKGYMKRQAIFSCLTCVPDGNAGVCTACSLICHDGHEIVELWTKRNFKCDCGNSKFGGFYCKLLANKDPENSENSYNQNFKGSYCTCGRPYPDPDVEDQVEMIQCCICEDWFHENHLGLQSSDELPKDGEGEPSYEDFICQSCAAKFSFLTLYPPTVWAPVSQTTVPLTSGTEGNVLPWTVSTGTSSKVENGVDTPNPKSEAASESSDGAASEISNGDKLVLNGDSSETCMGSNECTQPTVSSGKCFLQVDLCVAPSVSEKITPLFLAKNWRDLLCRCEVCAKFYSQSGIGFLIDREDSIAEYEKMATQKRQEKLQQQEGDEFNFLNSLGHVEKMEFLSGINDMKDEFRSFLESADTSKPITSADVQQIFENLAKKRQRLQ